MNNETLTLSHSSIDTFEQCARRWQLTKINRVKQAPSEALILGDAVHQAIEADGRTVVARVARLTMPQLIATFSYALGQRLMLDDPRHLLREQWNDLRIRGLGMLRAYHDEFAAGYAPDEVEAPFPEVTLASAYTGAPDVRFTGRLDARSHSVIWDIKTGKPWAPGIEHQKGQATAYLWADSRTRGEHAAKQVRFVVLSSHRPSEQPSEAAYTASVDIRTTTRTPAQLDAFEGRVRLVALRIAEAKRDGRFHANPGPLCGWCDVCHHCAVGQQWLRSRGRRPQPAIEAMMREVAG